MNSSTSRAEPRRASRAKLRRASKYEEREAEDYTARLVTISEPTGVASEAFRGLRTNLLYTLLDTPPKVIALTSPGPSEGKSTSCANLGVTLAQAAKRTLLLDCDFRRPVVHKIFGMRNRHGVLDVLVGDRSLQEVWKEPVEGLKVVPSGPIPPNPAEILGTQRFSTFLAGAREEFDYVLLDTSPVGLVSDPVILATQADGVLLVFDAQNTRNGAIRQAVRSLEAVGANILGTVMNNVKTLRGEGYRYYGYTYE